MRHNLVIHYDLFAGGSALSNGKNYAAMEAAIKRLGRAVKIGYTAWTVSSELGSELALGQLQAAADKNDKIFVVDATKDTCNWTPNYPAEQTALIKSVWEGQPAGGVGLGLYNPAPNVLAANLGLGLINSR
jgi:hypothetical protein